MVDYKELLIKYAAHVAEAESYYYENLNFCVGDMGELEFTEEDKDIWDKEILPKVKEQVDKTYSRIKKWNEENGNSQNNIL